MMQNNKDDINWALVALVLLVLLAIYVLSLGKVDLGETMSAPPEFKENKEQAKQRHKRLQALIEKKETIRNKLTKRFKRIYFAVRLGIIGLWGAYIALLVNLHLVQSLEDAINYSEAAILFWFTLNFLTFGNLSNLNSFLDLLKMRLENWTWGKYENIDKSIVEHKVELQKVQLQIKE